MLIHSQSFDFIKFDMFVNFLLDKIEVSNNRVEVSKCPFCLNLMNMAIILRWLHSPKPLS